METAVNLGPKSPQVKHLRPWVAAASAVLLRQHIPQTTTLYSSGFEEGTTNSTNDTNWISDH